MHTVDAGIQQELKAPDCQCAAYPQHRSKRHDGSCTPNPFKSIHLICFFVHQILSASSLVGFNRVLSLLGRLHENLHTPSHPNLPCTSCFKTLAHTLSKGYTKHLSTVQTLSQSMGFLTQTLMDAKSPLTIPNRYQVPELALFQVPCFAHVLQTRIHNQI